MTKPRSDLVSGRAPYALEPGTPALEGEFTVGRRVAIAATVFTGVCGAVLGSRLLTARTRESVPPGAGEALASHGHLVWARELAAGDLDALVAAAPTYLSVLHRFGTREPRLWLGWRRIAAAVAERPGIQDRTRIVDLLMQRIESAPEDLRAALDIEIRALAREVR